MGVSYRVLKSGDENAYRRVYLNALKTFPENFGTAYEEQVSLSKLEFEKAIIEASVDKMMFGAFAETDLKGIAGFRRGDRIKTRHRGELVQVFVSPDLRGNKVGESLVRSAVEAAFGLPGVELLELSTTAENRSAERLYEKLGFETYSIRKNYFKLGERYWDQRFMQLERDRYLGLYKLASSSQIQPSGQNKC